MFELLAVLDGSVNAAEARWTAQLCATYHNVRYMHERVANMTATTDQTARAAATRLLLVGLGSLDPDPWVDADRLLEGRWILLAHADEFYVQDARDLVQQLALRDPFATVVVFDILYAMPTRGEREPILAHNANGTHSDTFEPIEHLAHCDASFPFREPRLFRWTRGTRWGRRHGLTTPQVHPGHRVWPVARDIASRHSPFYVHCARLTSAPLPPRDMTFC
jgi:hypothetical protein